MDASRGSPSTDPITCPSYPCHCPCPPAAPTATLSMSICTLSFSKLSSRWHEICFNNAFTSTRALCVPAYTSSHSGPLSLYHFPLLLCCLSVALLFFLLAFLFFCRVFSCFVFFFFLRLCDDIGILCSSAANIAETIGTRLFFLHCACVCVCVCCLSHLRHSSNKKLKKQAARKAALKEI